MSILVAGGLGYIGSNISKALLEKDEDVIILDNLSNSHIGKAKLLKEVTNGKTIKLYTKDLLNEKDLIQVFKENQIESVIYTAESQAKNSKDYIRENVLMITNLLETMNTFNCKRLIFTSGDIYNERGSLREVSSTVDILVDDDLRAKTLKIQESIIKDFYKDNKENNLSICILRPFIVSGTDSSGMLGDIKLKGNDIFSKLMRYTINKEVFDFYSNYITFDKSLVRDYIHIKDVVRIYIRTLEYIRKSTNWIDIFNVCSGKPTSEAQVIKMYEIMTGSKINYQSKNIAIENLSDKVGDKTKINSMLKIDNELTLDSIIKNNFEFCNNYNQIIKDFKEAEKLLQKQNKKKDGVKSEESSE